MSKETRQDLDTLAKIVSRCYFAPYTKRSVIEAVIDQVSEKVIVEEPVDVERAVDKGPSLEAIGALIVGNLLALALLVASLIAGVVVLILANIVGIILIKRWRKTEFITEQTIKRVERVETREVVLKPETIVEEEIRSTKRLVGLGRSQVHFMAVSTSQGVFVTGPEPLSQPYEGSYPVLQDPDRVRVAEEEIEEELKQFSWILSGEQSTYVALDMTEYGTEVPLRGLEKYIQDYFLETATSFRDLHPVAIRLKAITDPGLLSMLVPGETREPLTVEGLEHLLVQLDGVGGLPLEALIRPWLQRWAKVNAALFQARKVSLCEQVGPECFDLGNQLTYPAFNFYCPVCTRKYLRDLMTRDYSIQNNEICEPIYFSKNIRCVHDPTRDTWRCLTCEGEFPSPDVVPVHKLLDELLLPAYDHLMEENKVERIKVHAGARDKEHGLQVKIETELDQIRFTHLSRLFTLADELERFRADIQGEAAAIESIKQILEVYNLQQDQVMKSIEHFSRGINQEIEERIQHVLESVDQVKDEEMTALHYELDELSRALRMEDQYRDQIHIETLMAIRENTAETRRGTEQIAQNVKETTAAVHEGTAVSREGFKKQAAITQQGFEKQAAVTQQGFDKQATVTQRGFDKQAAVTQRGFTGLQQKVAKGTAIQAAVAKQQGIDIFDQPMWRLDAKISQLGSTAMGKLTGRPLYETEAKKLGN